MSTKDQQDNETNAAQPPLRARMSVLYMDLSGAHHALAAAESEEATSALASLFNDAMEIILSGKGTPVSLNGTEITAVFGYPPNEREPALDAVRCAIKLHRHLSLLHRVGLAPFDEAHPSRFGIGVATGEILACMAGSFRRRELSLVGPAVLLARSLACETDGRETIPRSSIRCLVDNETRQATLAQIDYAQDPADVPPGTFAPFHERDA